MNKVKYYLPLIHKGTLSIYPFFRIGGFGLGNMLFPFFRSICFGIRDGAAVLYPFYNQIQPRNFFRERTINSLRNYNDIFSKFKYATLPPYKSLTLYSTKKWFGEDYISKKDLILFEGCKNYFFDLLPYRNFIQNFIFDSYNFKTKFDLQKAAFHIRLGDFMRTGQSLSKEIIKDKLKSFSNNELLNIEIYSDSNLNNLLKYLELDRLPKNVRLIKNSSPIEDILAMSKCKYIIGNPNSTFVEWARFLSPVENSQVSHSLINEKQFLKIQITPFSWDYFYEE